VRVGAALATLWTDVDLDGDGWAAGADLDPQRAWLQTGTHMITRVTGGGLVRAEYGSTKRSLRRLALPQELADRLRKRRADQPGDLYVFPNPFDRTRPREVSFVTKRVRRLFDSTAGDDGQPMTWASSHSLRRTLVTDAHDAGTPDRHIAGQTGHGRLQVLQDRYIARVPASTVAAHLRDLAPRVTPVSRGKSDSESDPEVNGR
jgi:integrase